MKILLYILAENAAQYAACETDEQRAHYIYPSEWARDVEWLKVGEVEAVLPPLDDAGRLAAVDSLAAQQQALRARVEAKCTALEGVKQSLLALTYEGSTL